MDMPHAVLADISYKHNSPNRLQNHLYSKENIGYQGTKRTAASPFGGPVHRSHNASQKRILRIKENDSEQQKCIEALWDEACTNCSEIDVQRIQCNRLKKTIQFANLERSFGA
ncbi:hypothetical protein DASB73_033400 [Starmerella bacillaris]|uniref:Uncharacterized protein n=1 Tax=Starmerella bacillaris TaxID=1247836 RepID=A0AAV5RMM2_STABA|nr:hypothetical protein DASB73_033400 [Starmerella bacillaris]